jgi:hypothetical protein
MGGLDLTDLILVRERWMALVNVVMNLRVSQTAGNVLTNREPVSFSRRTLPHGVSKYVSK